jgi:adenosylhomocysteine nucleosidase
VETILVIAAETRELSVLAGQLAARRRLGLPIAYSEAGQAAGRQWMLAANGAGPRLAAEAVRAAVAGQRPDRIVSAGYCGALSPGLVPGDIVVCDRVIGHDNGARFRTADEFGASCLSGDRVIQTAREKCYLRETTGASIVEMEAVGVAAQAAALGVPFHCIRAVTDTATEDLAIDFNATRDETGRFRGSRIAMAVLGSPRRILPELVKLKSRAELATARLGGYLVRHAY